MLIILRLIALLLLNGLLIVSCKKNSNDSAPPPPRVPPTISSFAITDFCKRTVTVTGGNFIADVSKDSIFFGGLKGVIDSANSTQIFAKYPSGNLSGNITVYCNGLSAMSSGNFTIGPPPTMTSFSPGTAGPGAIITITGQNFSNDILSDSVFFGSVKAKIISVSSNQITVKVPQGAASGSITVYSNCQSITSANQFIFSNKGIVYVAGNSGYCHAIDIASGTLVWKAYTHSYALAGPTYDNGVIYIGSTDVNVLDNNDMYALDAMTGTEIWKYHAGPWDGIPAINQGVLYAGSYDKKFYAFNAITGQKIWSYTAGGYFSNDGPTYYNGSIYTRNDDSYFYCLNASTGALNWRLPIWPGGNPAAANGIVYTAGAGVFLALDALTGATKWSLPMQYQSGNSPTVVNGKVYVASENHQIYCLDAMNGNIIWQIEASWWVASAVLVVNDVLYSTNGDGVVGAIDATNGTILWSRALPQTFLVGMSPVVANDIFFVGDDSGKLNALNAKTGAVIWTFSTGGSRIISSPCVVDAAGVVYHAGDSGNQQ